MTFSTRVPYDKAAGHHLIGISFPAAAAAAAAHSALTSRSIVLVSQGIRIQGYFSPFISPVIVLILILKGAGHSEMDEIPAMTHLHIAPELQTATAHKTRA